MCVCVAAAQSQGYTRTRIPFFFLSFYSSITKSGDVAQHETHFDLSLHPNSDREYCFLFLVIRLPRCARVNSFRRLSDLPYQIKLSSVPNYCVVTCWNHCTRSVSLVFSVVFFFLTGFDGSHIAIWICPFGADARKTTRRYFLWLFHLFFSGILRRWQKGGSSVLTHYLIRTEISETTTNNNDNTN